MFLNDYWFLKKRPNNAQVPEGTQHLILRNLFHTASLPVIFLHFSSTAVMAADFTTNAECCHIKTTKSLWIMLSYTITFSWIFLLYACIMCDSELLKLKGVTWLHKSHDLQPCKCIYVQFLCPIHVTLLITQYDICCNSPPILNWMHGSHAVLDGCQPWSHIICVMSFYYVLHVVLSL